MGVQPAGIHIFITLLTFLLLCSKTTTKTPRKTNGKVCFGSQVEVRVYDVEDDIGKSVRQLVLYQLDSQLALPHSFSPASFSQLQPSLETPTAGTPEVRCLGDDSRSQLTISHSL